METLADYGTVAYFAVDTFTTGIYRAWFSLGDNVAAGATRGGAARASSSARCARTLVARRGAQRGKRQPDAQPEAAGAPGSHGVARAALATAICALPIVDRLRAAGRCCSAGSHCRNPDCLAPRASANWRGTAFASRGMTAVLAVIVRDRGRLCAYGSRRARSRAGRAACCAGLCGARARCSRSACCCRVGAVDVWLAAFVQREFGVRTGLLLTGTIVALIYAYLVRYFAVAWNGIEPAFARITPANGCRRAQPRRGHGAARSCACMRRCWRAAPPRPRCSCSST